MQSGQGKNGTWKKQEFILETPGQYPKKVCLSLWGEKVDETRLSVGEKITASINIESREYNGRWYTDIRAWRIQPKQETPAGAPMPDMPPIAEEPAYASAPAEADDLPF